MRTLLGFLLLPAVLWCALLAPAVAQSFDVLVLEGDTVSGVGAVSRVENVVVNGLGSWIVEVDTDHPNTDEDGALLRDGVLYLREGQPLTLPAGASIGSFDSLTLNAAGNSGWNLFLDGTSGSSDDSGIFFNDTLVIQEGTATTAGGFTAGTPYLGFFETKFNAANQILVVATLEDPAIATSVDQALMLITVDGAGNLLSEVALAKEGDLLPGQSSAVSSFGTNPHLFALNEAGVPAFFADLDGSTSFDGTFYVGTVLVAQEGSASPVAGRNWESLNSKPIHLNNAGGYVFRGNLAGATTDDEIIVSNGAVVVREGDVLPDISPFEIVDFGSAPLHISDQGDVFWYGRWNDSSNNRGLFRNQSLLVQEGVTTIGGQVLQSLSSVQDAFSVSADGGLVLFRGELQGDLSGAFLLTLGLIMTDPTPGIAGQTNTVSVSNCTPGASVYFGASTAAGSDPLGCGGNTLITSLFSPTLLGVDVADAAGLASLSTFVPASFSGATAHLQAVEFASCRLSNPVTYTFP